MAGFLYRHTLIFAGPDHGATESLYFERPTDDLDEAANYVNGVKDKRAPLLGKEWQCKAERIALVRSDTGTKIVRRSLVKKFYKPGNQSQPSAPTGVSLQVQMADSFKRFKKLMFMCGPYRSIFPNADALDINAGSFLSNFNSWKSLIISLGMGWLGKTTAGQILSITNYVVDPVTGFTTYTLGAAATWPDGNKPFPVFVEFPLSRSALDGPQLVTKINATSCVTAQPRPAKPFTVQGLLRIVPTNFINLATTNTTGSPGTVEPQNPMERKRGRPLLAARGRRAVQIRF